MELASGIDNRNEFEHLNLVDVEAAGDDRRRRIGIDLAGVQAKPAPVVCGPSEAGQKVPVPASPGV
ncbi:hypothetical protein NCC78_00365 [Micromonospora phytophila]|uniref:hypothetical protein n=1 Tax=Micromonospora phytophila TaxID=709888 RepID=UPI00202FD931|nr:hypothetical protein [Micromonospora phytophila]MCM0673190.1 hypothetical protein [Micromonospora phytophila]